MQKETGFKDLLSSLMQKRWYVTAIVLGIFVLILLGLFAAIIVGIEIAAGLRELLLLLVGVFSGSFNKIIDYYYSNDDKDVMLTNKMDEENDTPEMLAAKMEKGVYSGQIKPTNKPAAPAIPDAFVQAATGARELAKEENKHTQEMEKIKNQQEYIMAKDQQEHEQEMEKLEFEYQTHRQCMHEWGDADNDGELECQKCGLLKDQFDESH